MVIIAPDDAGEILAFHAAAGTLAWKSPALPEVTHLLGVANGRLIATGNRVWSLDVRTGKVTVLRPPTAGQGARRAWPDSRGRVWISEWNAGKLGMYDPRARRWRWGTRPHRARAGQSRWRWRWAA